MKYKILSHNTVSGLEELVSNYIVRGWKPLGGVAIDREYIYQAMTWVDS